jgi:hypothetical protein
MDFKKLFNRAKDTAEDVVEKRGGTESLKEDAAELKDIATEKGSLSDKAKDAVEALKTPGDGQDDPPTQQAPAATPRLADSPEPAEDHTAAYPDPDAPVPPGQTPAA